MAFVAFDFGGTVAASDLTVLLGREHGVGTEMDGLVERGLTGEVDFETSLRQRAALLEGMQESQVERAYQQSTLREGMADLIGDLRRSGVTVAIITGSFEQGVRTALQQADATVDHLIANRLMVEDGAVTGEVEGPLVDGQKGGSLERIAVEEGVDLGRTIAVGDGATDLPMLNAAGTAIGFDPAEAVERNCDVVVPSVRYLREYFEQHEILDVKKPGE